MCGDFNTRYGDSTCTDATNLADLLGTSGFVQHVKGSTHERGNILDLVITSDVIATAVKPTTLFTDHYAIECERHQLKPTRLKRHVEYRRYAAIDNSWFAADLAAADFNAPELDPTALLYHYDYYLCTVVDEHAPLVSRTFTVRPMTPWHTSELAEEKRALHRAERHWRQSGLTVHRRIYTDRRNTFWKSLRKACSEHYRAEIEKAGGNMRLVYKIANALLRRGVDRPPTRRVRRNPRGTYYLIPAKIHRQSGCAVS